MESKPVAGEHAHSKDARNEIHSREREPQGEGNAFYVPWEEAGGAASTSDNYGTAT